MGDDITIGVTEIVNTIEVTAQPNDQIVDISIVDNADDVTLNITPTVIEINLNKSAATSWGQITGTLSDQTDLSSALALKANLVGGKVPASELPSYVDDIVEVANYASLPSTGETGKIYVTLDNNKIYRWSGSVYIEIASNNAVWGAITGTLSSQTDLQSALNAKQNSLSGTGFVKISGSTISYDNSTYVPTSRTITINGTAYDLSANRSWTINSATWGSITGTLSSQTDLQTALNAKANANNVVDLSSNQVIQGVKEFNLVRPTLGLNLSLRISDISTTEDNGMMRLYDNTIFNDLFVLESDGTVFAKSFIKKDGTSSQYLMADGSVSTGGGVSGSGTTNYIPKFTGSTALGNSAIYDNGTNIGVGTISPNYKFTVIGANPTTAGIVSNRFIGLRKEDNTLLGYLGLLGGDNGDNAKIIGYNSSGTQTFEINASTSATYFNGGNVGIGTTSPSALLDINGSSTVQQNLSIANDRQFTLYSDGTRMILNSVKNVPLAIYTNDTERMRITSGGNLLIGTTADNGDKLQVNGNLRIYRPGSTEYLQISVGDVTTNFNGYDSDGYMTYNFNSNGSTRMRIDSGGNVGIGTSSPAQKLDVFGASRISSTTPTQQFYSTGNGDVWGSIKAEVSTGTGGQLVFSTKRNGNTESVKIRVTENGNTLFYNPSGLPGVMSGIGSPYYGANITLASDIGSTQGANRIASKFDSTGRAGLVFETATNSQSYESDPTGLTYTEYMRITGLGNVGIGTTSPSTKLHVIGAITASAGFFNSDIRLKDLTDYDYNVADIKPISYFWKDGRDDKKHVGYSAQEVQKVMPDAVNEDEKGFLSVNYIEVLVAKIAELENRIKQLEK